MNILALYITVKTTDSFRNIFFVMDNPHFYILSDCLLLILVIPQQTMREEWMTFYIS